jgi:kinesin family protein 11
VHEETVRIVDLQVKDIATQMQALDDFVTRARLQNAQHHESRVQSLGGLATWVKSSYADMGSRFTSTYENVRVLGDEASTKITQLQDFLSPLETTVNQPLSELRSIVLNTTLQEYQPTGETPQKAQYLYPTDLPHTEAHETLLTALRRPVNLSPSKTTTTTTIPVIFNDGPDECDEVSPPSSEDAERKPQTPALGLREIDININARNHVSDDTSVSNMVTKLQIKEPLVPVPSFKRSASAGKLIAPRSAKKAAPAVVMVPLGGRENENAVNGTTVMFARGEGGGRRRSPRLG